MFIIIHERKIDFIEKINCFTVRKTSGACPSSFFLFFPELKGVEFFVIFFVKYAWLSYNFLVRIYISVSVDICN